MIGRTKELAELARFAESDTCHVMTITGRAGIGKTAIVKEFIRGRRGLLFTAYPTTADQELSILAHAMGLEEDGYSLPELLEALANMASEERLIFAIDHYPNFAKADSSFDKTLVEFVQGQWADGRIKLILISDAYLHMDKLVFAKKSPWKDVEKTHMELGPLPYYEALGFFPGVESSQAAEYYGVTGGIPHYLKWAADSTSRTIERIYLPDENEALLMPERTIQSELREMSYYNRLLTALAEGKNRVNELSAEVGKPKDVVVPYLNTLMSIGIVTKENPVTEPTNRRKTRYSIVHFADRFWYQLVVPNIHLYYKRRVDTLLEEHIMPGLQSFMEPVFIQMCGDYLKRACELDKLPFTIDRIGNWWENDEEHGTTQGFDLVATGQSNGEDTMIFARCFYRDAQVGMADLKELIELTKHLSAKGKAAFYLIFSKTGFEENARTVAATIKNIMLISLDEVLKIEG